MRLALAAALAVLALAGGAAAGVGPSAPTLPAVSPDGTHIAWVDGFGWKIWEAAPDGSGAHVIAPAPTTEGISDLHWTSQGLVVDSNFTLYLVRAGAKAVAVRGLNGGFDFAAAGTRVATGYERGPGAYTVADLVTGKRWRYGSAKTVNHFGSLSPDGARVAWSGPGGIWVGRLGRPAHRLAAAAGCPTWSSDGRSIAFMRLADLRVIPASGGRSRLLAAKVGGCQQKAWSPDSSTIAYSGPRGLILVDVRSGAVRHPANALGDATWAPDGRALYAISQPRKDAGSNCLDIVKLDSTTLRAAVVVRGCP